jgi:transcriptional regulator with GAF, ATPase, and Fis domain
MKGTRTTTACTTDDARSDDGSPQRVDGLALVLELDRITAGGALLAVSGPTRAIIGRGEERARRPAGRRGVVRWDIPDAKLSSSHAEFSWTDAGLRVRDLGSTNGTFVGGERVTEVTVPRGAFVRLGHTILAAVEDVSPETDTSRSPLSVVTLAGHFARELRRLERLAPSPLPVLLLGETGTGKEVIARAVHERSGRPGRFVAVNCGAFPKDLVESSLFGHVRGAFSGAVRDEAGFARAASGGTLFLDEVGDLPLSAQGALLRLLQEGEVNPIGASQAVHVDVRVLAATHRPLDRMVDEGLFRADLYARLSGFVGRLPPLRERTADLGHLCAGWIADGRLPEIRLRKEAAERLLVHDWPFNVRELLQTLQAASLLAEQGIVRTVDLPESLGLREASAPAIELSAEDALLRDDLAHRLAASGGNVSQVARDMQKARQQIQRWMKRFGLRV